MDMDNDLSRRQVVSGAPSYFLGNGDGVVPSRAFHPQERIGDDKRVVGPYEEEEGRRGSGDPDSIQEDHPSPHSGQCEQDSGCF